MALGLSPRVRGSPLCRRGHHRRRKGSIPASTGQPCDKAFRWRLSTVYPREYGAACLPILMLNSYAGLSPRVRGSRRQRRRASFGLRSIPASTGQPVKCNKKNMGRRVYPREYGAADKMETDAKGIRGLSPRVRGSPMAPRPTGTSSRSIPASTGQPACAGGTHEASAVYPREYGAAVCDGCGDRILIGLSPRVRGSPLSR